MSPARAERRSQTELRLSTRSVMGDKFCYTKAGMDIKIVKDSISRQELITMASEEFGDMVKAVVDIEQEIMAVGGELHADEEVVLTEQENSKREHTWGINIYPKKSEQERIEFDSMVNLKPHYGNRSRDVENPEIKEKIRAVVKKLVAE